MWLYDIIFLTIVFLLLKSIYAVPADKDHLDLPWRSIHEACEPSHLGLSEFSGFRIIHQVGISFPAIDHTVITQCHQSRVEAIDAYYPVNKTVETPWGVRFCSSEHSSAGSCYIIARKKEATHRSIAMYYPGDWVGGIFRCPGTLDDNDIECTNENAFPLYPIMADIPALFWDKLPDLRHYDFRFPMLKAYPVGANLRFGARKYVPYNWFNQIDIFENYDYSTDERNMIRRAQDFITNMFGFVVGTRVGPLISLGWDNEVKDYGDGRARRSIYHSFSKSHFQPEHWETEPHFTPIRNYTQEKPIKNLDHFKDIEEFDKVPEKSIGQQAFYTRLRKLQKSKLYHDWTTEIEALATGKIKLQAVDFLKYLPFIPDEDMKRMRNKAYEMYDIVLKPDNKKYYHPNPPENAIQFLKRPYITEADMNDLLQ